MRKSFSILIAIFVCALSAMIAAAKPANTDSLSRSAAARLSPVEVESRIADGLRILKANSSVSLDTVRLAVFNSESNQLAVLSLPKTDFLTQGAVVSATTNAGREVRVEVVRANGVNTAVELSDATGKSLIPLVVQYPIEKNGAMSEVAYYSSAHPALLSAALASTGQSYIRKMLDQAAARLAAKGVFISGDIVDMAEHLCVVEHTDHKRFKSENQSELFPEILALYALNQTNTFRYSVSSAGAGGMIQMIPKTYEAVRQQHPNVTLNPDFVNGMRDHGNALQAMLLYMNDTWNGLARSATVQDALRNGIATKPQLLAAGYNSNPARLPNYLEKGGAQWQTFIPAETQMYLAIYSSVDTNLDFSDSRLAAAENSDAFLIIEPTNLLPSLSIGRWLISAGTFMWLR